MRAEVRAFLSPDVELAGFSPQDPADVGVFVQVFVGPDEGLGSESFDLEVVTPRRLLAVVQHEGPIIGRHHLIVDRWDWPRIRDFLTTTIEAIEGETWDEIAEQVARIGHWEFEDYREVDS